MGKITPFQRFVKVILRMKTTGILYSFNKRDKYHYISTLFLLIVFMTAVTGICSQINAWELLVFIGFQLLCIFLPGLAVMTLMPVKNLGKPEKLLLIYASGYMVTIILYAALMATVGNAHVRAGFFPLPVLACAILAFRKKKQNGLTEVNADKEKDAFWIGTVLAVFFLSLISFSLRWKIPYTAGANNFETDFLYWAGDIVALKKQFPPKEFRTLNPVYRYHYWGALQQAAVSTVTGIQAVKVAVCYSNIEAAVLLGLPSSVLVSKVIRNKTAQIFTLLLMLISTGYEEITVVPYMRDLYQVPMSYNIAHGLGITVVILLLVQMENERLDIYNLIWSFCCLLCCTGTKSAAGVVILCGAAAVYLYLFFSRGSGRSVRIALMVFLLVFGAVGAYFWPTARNFNLKLYLPEIHLDSGRQIMRSLYACIVWVGKYGIRTVASNFWIFIPAGIYSVYLIICKKMKKEYALFVILVLAGTMGNYLLEFNASSQMYFSIITFPFAAVLTGRFMEKIFQGYLSEKKQYCIATFLGAIVIIFMLCNNYEGYFGRNLVMGLKNIGTPQPADKDTGMCLIKVSQAQCEAYTWIRDNTDEDVILLSDRVWGNHHDPTSVFSERYVYVYHDLEVDYLRGISCFGGNQEAVRYYAEMGLDYIVQRKFHTPLFTCPEDVGEVVFENDEVAVYKLFWGQHGKNGVFY